MNRICSIGHTPVCILQIRQAPQPRRRYEAPAPERNVWPQWPCRWHGRAALDERPAVPHSAGRDGARGTQMGSHFVHVYSGMCTAACIQRQGYIYIMYISNILHISNKISPSFRERHIYFLKDVHMACFAAPLHPLLGGIPSSLNAPALHAHCQLVPLVR